MSYERDNIHALSAYAPGEQPESREVVKLNTNENPYPPPAGVLEAIAKVTGDMLRRYPPPLAPRFRQVAAMAHGLKPEQVIATNAGDELLRLVVTVFCRPQTESRGKGGLGYAEPSYSLYPVLGRIHDTQITTAALNDDFNLPDDLADRMNKAGCNLLLIVNPHAPSGRLSDLKSLESIARTFKGVIVIDEAYVDFAETSALPLLEAKMKLDNVLLLRTLSKGYSLAGLRFGYGLGHPDLIAALDKARDSYNTDIIAQTAAIAAIENREYAKNTWQKVKIERVRVSDELRRRGFTVYPSHANFILVAPPGSSDTGPSKAASLYETLKQQHVYVRYFNQDRLRDKLRITIGRPEENDTLLRVLDVVSMDGN